MTDTKHTPGPWVAKKYENSVGEESISIFAFDGTVIADNEPYYPQELDPANAHLIASAPDLLEALEGLRECIMETRGANAHDAVDKADAAIAKAKGQT